MRAEANKKEEHEEQEEQEQQEKAGSVGKGMARFADDESSSSALARQEQEGDHHAEFLDLSERQTKINSQNNLEGEGTTTFSDTDSDESEDEGSIIDTATNSGDSFYRPGSVGQEQEEGDYREEIE